MLLHHKLDNCDTLVVIFIIGVLKVQAHEFVGLPFEQTLVHVQCLSDYMDVVCVHHIDLGTAMGNKLHALCSDDVVIHGVVDETTRKRNRGRRE